MAGFFKKLFTKFSRGSRIDWDELEADLVTADIGIRRAMNIADQLRESKGLDAENLVEATREVLRQAFPATAPSLPAPPEGKPLVILVVGVNGTGKSTLLRILAGAEEPDEGRVSRDPNVRLNYLPQLPAFDEKNTVLEQVFAGVSPEARALAEYEAKTILTRLGVPLFEQRVGVLSGGQRKRVALCSALACPCDVLILDEPTNHLDSGMVAWLEDELQRRAGNGHA